MANLDTLTAAPVAAGVAAGDFSATEVAKASLDAVESRDPAIQAFLEVSADLALQTAAATDAARAAGKPLGPLAGVPVAFKDNMHLVGTRTTCASRMLENYDSTFTATCVQRLLDAEVVQVVAVTNPLAGGKRRMAMIGVRTSGATGPVVDNAAAGAFLGLRTGHTRTDMLSAVFAAIHQQNRRMLDPKEIIEVLSPQGVDAKAFGEAYNSFGVKTKMQRANKLADAYNIDGVPALGVNGKYLTACLLYTSPSPRDRTRSRMPSSA